MTIGKVSPESIRQTKAVMEEIQRITTRPWNIMEICGGQTHSIMEYGLDQLLPSEITLIHGPGCPVCVTSLELVEHALQIAAQPDVIFTSFGDMLRVPGSSSDLNSARAKGADVRVVYSPMDAVKMAQSNPDKQVIFFAIGFETTVPAIACDVVARTLYNRVNNFFGSTYFASDTKLKLCVCDVAISHPFVPDPANAPVAPSAKPVDPDIVWSCGVVVPTTVSGVVCTINFPSAKVYRSKLASTRTPLDIKIVPSGND